ncbi:UPF0489 protein C5orf22 [Hondaea fermentalgiana]|uniref:UPF0489 protein C5orf22 n=1 Tax=Hondaea fermentalgiana TaxID=2315210 RepID=A0A2R5G5M2_9STRA|nr:UPF0489 protein C5orf22 [Hondaea fermentalgiana]|eukprot:GBG26280.1 UPF0489 protein C5orf22 [Hondaea fermentalgiana]
MQRATGTLAPEEVRVLAKRRRQRAGGAAGEKEGEAEKKIKTLPVYVSGDHNEALESLHAAIRVGEVAFSGLAMLHVDSHPDLMVPPRMPADLVFKPRELHWELAKSETGIAEFILPAVYAGHLERLVWLRPTWADQLPDGQWEFKVGKAPGCSADEIITEDDERVNGGPLRVTWRTPYYEDEGLTCPVEDLQGAKSVEILVAGAATCTPQAFVQVCGDRPWVLDICLDYFSVNNPFYVDLQTKLGVKAATLCQEVYAGETLAWRRLERARQLRVPESEASVAAQEHDPLKTRYDAAKRKHDDAIAALLSAVVENAGPDMPTEATSQASAALCACFEPGADVAHDKGPSEVVEAFVDLVRGASAETRALIASCGPNLDLPHHRSSESELDSLFAHLRELLLSVSASAQEPSIVTIAKSSSDLLDYTPVDQVQGLFDRTLAMLRTVYPDRELDISFVDEDEDEDEDGDGNKNENIPEKS